MDNFFRSLYVVHRRMQFCEPYFSGLQNYCDAGLVSNIGYCLEFFSSYDGEIAYQASENK